MNDRTIPIPDQEGRDAFFAGLAGDSRITLLSAPQIAARIGEQITEINDQPQVDGRSMMSLQQTQTLADTLMDYVTELSRQVFTQDHGFNPDLPVPVIYSPNNGIPVAYAMEASTETWMELFQNTHPVQREDEPHQDYRRRREMVSEQALEIAEEAGVLAICDFTLRTGSTLMSMTDRIPAKYDGQLLIFIPMLEQMDETVTTMLAEIRETHPQMNVKLFIGRDFIHNHDIEHSLADLMLSANMMGYLTTGQEDPYSATITNFVHTQVQMSKPQTPAKED